MYGNKQKQEKMKIDESPEDHRSRFKIKRYIMNFVTKSNENDKTFKADDCLKDHRSHNKMTYSANLNIETIQKKHKQF